MANITKMDISRRIDVLAKLGELLRNKNEYLEAVMHRAKFHNPWFTIENQQEAIAAIANNWLKKDILHSWISRYSINDKGTAKTVGVVLAGNIPLVGFHDLLCIFISGHKAQIKYSDKDKYLPECLLKFMFDIDPASQEYFEIKERLNNFDAVIATGSNNTSRYFESYFSKYPHIIRKNRNAVAVLTGKETPEDLNALGRDIFQYFGLGCRNVSKIYVPENYNFQPLLEALHEFNGIILHNKYKNNFDYNYALYVLNKVPYMANGCIILTESQQIASRIANLHYEYYSGVAELNEHLRQMDDQIQCIVGPQNLINQPVLPFGAAQSPALWDYADGVDTLEFLTKICE